MAKKPMDAFLAAALIVTVIFAIYWMAFAANAYNTFHEYDDLGIFAHNMYLDINYPGIMGGALQFLIFGNHIAPDQLLVLPFFYLDQSALTLLAVQVAVLSAAGLAVFITARRLLGNQKVAFMLFLAFILNPGVWGMLVYDYHTEAFIILFYVMAFYFFMTLNKKLFIVSLLLLLGTIEQGPFLGATLGMGMLFYSLLYAEKDANRKPRIMLAASGIGISLLVFVIYNIISITLLGAYPTPAFAQLPPYLRVDAPIGSAVSQLASGGHALAAIPYLLVNPYSLYGITVALLLFGIAVFFDPLLTLIMAAPYLYEAYVVQNHYFLVVFNQYYGFVIGCVFAGAVIGLMRAQKKQGILGRLISRRDNGGRTLTYLVMGSIGIVTVILLVLYPTFVVSKNTNNLTQDFLFQKGTVTQADSAQIDSMLALIPKNASLIAPFFVSSHVADREYFEDTGYTMVQWYFTPQYLLVDTNLNVSLNAYVGVAQLVNFSKNNTYAYYGRNGSAILFKYVPQGS